MNAFRIFGWRTLACLLRARPGEGADLDARWRKRVGVEPTILAAKDRINGFEGHEDHRAPGASVARRTVEMPAHLSRLLADLRKKQTGTKFVFQDEIGRPLDPDQLYAVLHTAQDAAKVDHFGLHGLRHLCCSLLVNSGAPVKNAQTRLGHASATTTFDICAHAISQDGRKFSAAVEAAFSSASNLLAENNAGQEGQGIVNWKK